jgi:hypothetical protein
MIIVTGFCYINVQFHPIQIIHHLISFMQIVQSYWYCVFYRQISIKPPDLGISGFYSKFGDWLKYHVILLPNMGLNVYHLIVELEGLQPSGLYIHEQMYIAFPSSLVPSSPGTAYHQKYVRTVPSASSRQGLGL